MRGVRVKGLKGELTERAKYLLRTPTRRTRRCEESAMLKSLIMRQLSKSGDRICVADFKESTENQWINGCARKGGGAGC